MRDRPCRVVARPDRVPAAAGAGVISRLRSVAAAVAAFVALVPATIAVVAAPGMVVPVLLAAGLAGAGTVFWVRENPTGDAVAVRDAARRGGLVAAATTAGAGLVVIGLALVLGAAAGALLGTAAVVGGAVWLWRHPSPARWGADVRRWPDRLLPADRRPAAAPDPGRDTPGDTKDTPAPPSVVPTLADMPVGKLCLVWQRTYFALLDLPPGASVDELVTLRKQLLDEIERRDPAGFTRWLDTGARAGSDPGRYLAGP